MKPTIKDVAKLANVSVSTVSRVINNKESVHESTRQIVLDAIDKLEFVPNQIARNLTSRSSQMIGVIVPHIGSAFYSDLLEGIEKKATSYGYHIIFCNTQDDLEKEATYLKVFDQYKVDGLIVASNFLRIDDLLELNIPTVTVDHVLNEGFPSVTSDNIKGGELAAQELVDQGAKNVLLFRGPSFLMTTTERTMGCINIFEKHNTKYEIYDFDLIYPDINLIENILKNHQDLDGIICYGDNLAIATLSILNKLGMKVPDDVLIIGYDNMPISKWITPSLTTVEQDVKLMGRTAFNILYNLIKEYPIDEHNYIVDVELVTRKSTKR